MLIRLPFRGDWVIEEYWEIPVPEAKRVVSAWLNENPAVIGELKLQYQAIKEAGRRSLEQERQEKGGKHNLLPLPKVGEKKTGRNDPCPCGSGKKYKKCCGP
jgi:preprotein translocase subunit SecA